MASIPSSPGEPTAAGALYPAVRGGLAGLLDTLTSIQSQGGTGVLGIVFATAGSTYQKPGALILLDRTGMRHGAISGGCLEPEVEERAREVCDSRAADVIDFDTRSDEDLLFGSGTGCRGRIHLLLLPQPPGAPLTQALARMTTSGASLQLSLSVEGPETGCGTAFLKGETWLWERDGQRAALPSRSDGQRVAWPPRSETQRAPPPLSDDLHGTRPTLNAPGSALARVQAKPPPRVLLFGSGPETSTLYLFMQRLGWGVTVVEHRGRWLKFAHAAGVRDIIEAPPDDAATIWRRRFAGAAVAMTHNYALDTKHLKECAESDLPYIGLLGPAARRDAMLADLGEEYAKRLQGRLHAPVGLPLGGRGPEPLALAIVAELQQHFAQHA